MVNHFQGAKVINLKRKDFDNSMKLKKAPGKPGLIAFHANWCSFCVQLSPVYKELSKKSGIKIYAIEVDAPNCKEIFEHYMVQGFPSIRYISKDGKIDSENYYGERNITSLQKYIKEKSTSGGAKRKVAKKQVKKCTGKGCKGKCSGKCKKQKGGCSGGKCKGACKGGACKKQKGGAKKRGRGRPKDSTIKKLKKKINKSIKKVKKMLGGKKKKVVKKTVKKRKTIKKRGKK